MKEILALIGSPRKMGNSELAARFVASEAGCESLKIVRLDSKKILPCKACYRCLTGDCPLDDDYGEVLARILSADGVIISVPSYFFGPNASVKKFLDRGLQFYSVYDRLHGKPAVGLAISGMKHGEGYTLLALDNMLLRMGLENRGTATLYGALPGELFTKDRNIETLGHIAGLLSRTDGVPSEKSPARISCGECGNSYFHFSSPGSASCLICGTRHTVGREVELTKVEGTGVILHTLEEQAEHREWLIGMKNRFLEKRSELKKVIKDNMRPGEVV